MSKLPKSELDTLFTQGRAEAPSSASASRIAEQLGLASSAASGAALVATASSAKTSSLFAAQSFWLLGGAFSLAVGIAGTLAVQKKSEKSVSQIASSQDLLVAESSPAVEATKVQALAPTLRAKPAVQSPRIPPAVAPPKVTKKAARNSESRTDEAKATKELSSPANAVDPLAEQVRTIEAARNAIAQGKKTAALRSLDTLLRRYPHGALKPEALFLAVKAAHSADSAPQKQKYLSRLHREFPNSVARRKADKLVLESDSSAQ